MRQTRTKTYLLLARSEDANYAKAQVVLGRPGSKVPVTVMVGGVRRRFEPEHAFPLRGGHPFRRDGFWTPLIDFLDVRPRWLLYYAGVDPEPKDPLSAIMTRTELNPRLTKVLTKSTLFADYLKRLRYDKGISPTLLVFIVVGLVGVLALMYFGGYWQ